MIEKLKQRPKTINLGNLNFVVSWWDKDLIKNSQKVEKYLKRFQKESLIVNTKDFQKNQINYKDYLAFSNKTLEFLLQKEKQIVKEFKVITKFYNLINAFAQNAGILANIQTIDRYYETVGKQEVGNRKEFATHLGNEVITLMYDDYKKLLLKTLGKDDTIKEKLTTLYKTEQIDDTKLYDASTNIKILFKFTNMAFNKKIISQQEFNIIYFNTIFLGSYLEKFSKLYYRFVNQLM